MLQAPADEPEESCGKVKASREAACSCRVSPQLAAASPACCGRCHLQDRTRIVTVAIVTLLVIGCTIVGAAARDHSSEEDNGSVIGTVIGATVGAGLALVGLPVCLGALGFTGAGIAAGSIAANMMSAAAIANGGGVAAGSTVAVLQSIGAAGLPLAAKVGLGSAGAASGAWLSK
ncbi:unnamed protein product [Coccothraustes coccothraustes]